MSKFSISLKKYEKALLSLKQSMDELYSDEIDEKYIDFVKDSVIQRFEYTSELLWKTIKLFLFEIHWLDCASPKSCLKQAHKVWLIDNLNLFFEMVYIRNITSHTYNSSQIDDILNEIDKFLPYLFKVYELLKSNCSEN